jgi:hypothetical protein
MTLILNGTDNAVGSPAVQGGTGGTSTGVYYPSANAIAISTGGVNALTISSTQAATFANNVTITGTSTHTGNASFSNITATGTLTTASQGISYSSMPAGSVLQVVQGTPSTTSTATTGTSYVATAATVTITPKFSTSKILILHNAMIDIQASGVWCYYTLYRGATNLYVSGTAGAIGGVYINGGADNHVPCSISYLDSPATTSATTYTVYIKSSNSGSNARYNPDGWYMTINALEVAA